MGVTHKHMRKRTHTQNARLHARTYTHTLTHARAHTHTRIRTFFEVRLAWKLFKHSQQTRGARECARAGARASACGCLCRVALLDDSAPTCAPQVNKMVQSSGFAGCYWTRYTHPPTLTHVHTHAHTCKAPTRRLARMLEWLNGLRAHAKVASTRMYTQTHTKT